MFNLVRWRFTFPIFLMISMLFPYFRSITMLFSQNDAYTIGNQVILDDENHGWVEISYAEKESEIEWTIEYQKFLDSSTDDEVERLMKLKVDFSDNTAVNIVEESGLTEKNGWYQEEDYSPQSEGRLVLTTPKEQTEMTIELQMDELRITEVTTETINEEYSTEYFDTEEKEIKNILPAELAGPHTMTAEVTDSAEIQTTETTQATTESSSQEDSTPATTRVQETITTRRADNQSTDDPFFYTTGVNVFKHPAHHTNEYLTGATTSSTNDDIRNYNYGETDSQTGIPPVEPAYNELDFNTGYHDYGDGLLKKTVIPIEGDPTKFKIQLDIIGNAVQQDKKMDVVLVLDKSASMVNNQSINGSRWATLHRELTRESDDPDIQGGFIQELLKAGDVRIGLASFNAPLRSGPGGYPQAELGNFNPGGEFYGFSNNIASILSNTILSTSPQSVDDPVPSGGTPTFLGFDAGYELLTNPELGVRPDAEKILIVLTDGLPTYSPSQAYINLTSDPPITPDSPINGVATDRVDSGGIRTYYLKSNYYGGTGNPTRPIIQSNIDYIKSRIPDNRTIRYYSLGFYIGTNGNENTVSDMVDKVLEALGPDGTYYTTGADLVDYLADLLVSVLSKTINNAILTDPMSIYVERTSSVTSTALSLSGSGITTTSPDDSNYPAYAAAIDQSLPKDLDSDNLDNPIQLTNINLGRNNGIREGYRIEYEVTLKEEYRNGNFYPTNDATYLKNGDNYLHFAVPSVRYKEPLQEFAVDVKKIWEDDGNKWGRQEEIILKLQKKNSEGQWEDVPGKTLIIPPNSTNGDLEDRFTGIPGYETNGDRIVYRIVEVIAPGQDPPIDGYLPPVYSPEEFTIENAVEVTEDEETVNKVDVTVTNTLPFTDFEFTKVDHGGEMPLKNAKFTLYKGQGEEAELVTHFEEATSGIDGKVIFEGLPAGTYTIKETSVPPGYCPRADIEFEIALDEETGEAYVKETNLGGTTDLKASNELYPFRINLIKTDDGDSAVSLAGAKFVLTGSNLENPVEVTSGNNGLVTFAELTPGAYILTETEPPPGHQVAAGSPWNITIKDDGTVEIIDASGMPVEVNISYATEDNEREENMIDEWYVIDPKILDYQLIIEKEDNFGNQLSGARFNLKNEDDTYDEDAPEENSPSASIQFTKLKPGRYILTEIQVPNDHVGLKNPIVIVINDDGTVEIDGEPHEVEAEGNIIRLTIKNRKKGVLPFTGGALHTASLLASVSVFLLAIGISIYYGYRNRKGAK